MARNLGRAELLSSSGTHLRYISSREAYSLIDTGDALKITSNRDLAKQKQLVIKLKDHRGVIRVVASLTFGDMQQNAESVADRRGGRARNKVEAWPTVHDTFAVTVVAGRGIFIPDPAAAEKRATKMRKAIA